MGMPSFISSFRSFLIPAARDVPVGRSIQSCILSTVVSLSFAALTLPAGAPAGRCNAPSIALIALSSLRRLIAESYSFLFIGA
jgi:hypothetical protein